MLEERIPYFYAVLELRPSATSADIKRAWLEQVQVWHPDRFSHSPTLHRKAEARTQMINQAYQTLSDPSKRARYDATTRKSSATKPPARPSPPPRPQPTPRSRQALRGPQSLIMLSRQGQPKIPVPAIQMLVDSNEKEPYDFRGLVRIAGTIRQTLPAGDYAIAEAPGLLCVERTRVAELYASTSNSSDHRSQFLRELERLLPFPNRFLVVDGRVDQAQGRGRLSEYLKNGVMDFLDAMALKYGLQV
ncbi:MAG TPA: DnaJ domain-containing protein, partial [Nitrospiraceae bacterium]|nr:DnaJ domain-containing protein [Nitrospiraceae bacterium]